jgi:phenylacetaldehyde dehydrogenase
MKKVTLELGGKSPTIVFGDVDAGMAIAGAASAIFFNHGQTCCAGSRLYVQSNRFDEIIAGVSAIAEGLKMGPGLNPESEIGPLVSATQRDRVMSYISQGLADGARAAAGGRAPDTDGYYVQPTVFTHVNAEMAIVREEIFGPVVVAAAFDDLDEIAAVANRGKYGLAASIWTKDISTVHRLAPKLRAGTVWVNCHNVLDPTMPFGGYKQSGWGRELGKEALHSYLESKSMCIRI